MTAPIASGWSKIAGWDSNPLEKAVLARRTPTIAIQIERLKGNNVLKSEVQESVSGNSKR